MDQNPPWGWQQQPQGGYQPLMPGGLGAFAFPLAFDFSWGQQTAQGSYFGAMPPPQPGYNGGWDGSGLDPSASWGGHQESQPRQQNDDRYRGQGYVDRSAYSDRPRSGSSRQQSHSRRRDEGNHARSSRQDASSSPSTTQRRQNYPDTWSSQDSHQSTRQWRPRRRGAAGQANGNGNGHWQRRGGPPTSRHADDRRRESPPPRDHPPTRGPFSGSSRPLRQKNNAPTSAGGSDFASRSALDNLPPPTAASSRDQITPPSAASGGVPDPTASYLARSSLGAGLLPKPRALLVVIDLNGTLLFRPHRRAPTRFVERPRARAFLGRCLAQHRVVIWSSARPENVRRMCAQLLAPEELSRVVAVWGRDRFGLTADDYNRRTQCYKRLTRLWDDPVVAASHPLAAEGGRWGQADTVLIDDSAEKARSEPHNAVTLPEFVGDLAEAPQVLPLVENYLDVLACQTDISTYIRANPFAVRDTRPEVVEEA